MTLKVHGPAFSTCTKRITTLLEELQVPYELQDVNLWDGSNKKPEYLKMQPFGKVPVLEDSDLGTTIFESRSILRYLANKYADKGLAGTDAKSKALVDNWLEAEAQNLNPYTQGIVGQRVFAAMKGGKCDEAKVKELVEGLETVLDVLDKHLANQQFLAGDNFTIADIAALPYLHLTMTRAGEGDVFKKRPNVQAWADRCFARDSWKKAEAKGPMPGGS